jgi:membrane associated rhomboid family serine protease
MDQEKRSLLYSLAYPALFLFVIWTVKIIEVVFDVSFAPYGIEPLKVRGLVGIATAPLIHADFKHLFSNSIPLFILGGCLFYFYKEIAFRIFFLMYFITGLWVWFLARGGIHIGASGLVYALAAFLFTSGIIRRDVRLLAITFLVTFLYGSMVWGIFPGFYPERNISWESHLMGLLAGVILAFFFRSKGPRKKVYEWELEPEEDDEVPPAGPASKSPGIEIRYIPGEKNDKA